MIYILIFNNLHQTITFVYTFAYSFEAYDTMSEWHLAECAIDIIRKEVIV